MNPFYIHCEAVFRQGPICILYITNNYCIYIYIFHYIIFYTFQLRTTYQVHTFFLVRVKILAIVSSKAFGWPSRAFFCIALHSESPAGPVRNVCFVQLLRLICWGDLMGFVGDKQRFAIWKVDSWLSWVFSWCLFFFLEMLTFLPPNMWLISSPNLAFIHMIHTSWVSPLPSDSCDTSHNGDLNVYLSGTPKNWKKIQ